MISILGQFFGWFRNHNIGGIPLDIPAHIVVGVILFVLLLRARVQVHKGLIVVLVVAIGKEVFDASLLQTVALESLKDIFMTTVIPALFLLWMKWNVRTPKESHL